MKNYLFAPFKDDEEKIAEFEHLNKTWNFSGDVIVFLGRLESYYDVITSKLKADESESIGWIEQYRKGCKNYRKEIEELKAELKDEKYYCKEMISKLKAENYHDEIKDLHKERDDLFKENKRLKAEKDTLLEESNLLKAEVKEKEREYHMLASSKTSHYPKEYKAEADEYFHHNPQCKKLLFFILDGNDFDWDEDNDGCNGMNGEYNSILFADDCIAEIDNDEGSK